MNSVKVVHRNSNLWWIAYSWAEWEQSKNNLGEKVSSWDAGEGARHLPGKSCPCSKGGCPVWYLTGRANAGLRGTLVGRGGDACIRLNCGCVDLFNQAHVSISIYSDARMLLYFLAEAWVDALNPKRPETGNQGQANEKNLLLRKWRVWGEILLSLDWSLKATTLSSSQSFFSTRYFQLSCLSKAGHWQQINTS